MHPTAFRRIALTESRPLFAGSLKGRTSKVRRSQIPSDWLQFVASQVRKSLGFVLCEAFLLTKLRESFCLNRLRAKIPSHNFLESNWQDTACCRDAS